jgi:hypothetical protein
MEYLHSGQKNLQFLYINYLYIKSNVFFDFLFPKNPYYILMLTKTKIQYIKSLHDKQGRRES